jgi:DNA repair exonuclease SbcCD ATPase subunit
MILKAIEVSGWKCFVNPVRVGPFWEGLNVLHAPNATGKSTLFEALLRGLLDTHSVKGEAADAIRPWGRSLAPTVTVEFAHAGVEYRIAKRFLDEPFARLERKEKGRFARLAEGVSADDTVRQMLTQNPPGRGLARQENWGLAQILWAPQGNLAISKLSGDLVSDIRSMLGVQIRAASDLEERIADTYHRFFTPTGKLKTGKDAPPIVQLQDKQREATEKHQRALELHQQFEQASRKVEELRARRVQAKRDARALKETLQELSATVTDYNKLLAEKGKRTEALKATEAQYNEINQRVEAIKNARKELEATKEALSRFETDLPLRTREAEAHKKEADSAKSALGEARKQRQTVDDAQAKADLARRYAEASKEAERLGVLLERIGKAERLLAQRKRERTKLLAPDAGLLRKIRSAIKQRDDARVRLESALITLEVVPDSDVTLNVLAGETTGSARIPAGNPFEIKGSPEVAVGIPGFGRIRASGPVGSVEEHREARDNAERKILELTAGFGTGDLDELESLSEKRKELDNSIAEGQTQLDTLLAGQTREDVEGDKRKADALSGEILKSHPGWQENPPDANTLSVAAKEMKQSFITRVEDAEKNWEKAQQGLTAASQQKADVEARLEENKKRLTIQEAAIARLMSDGKSDEARTKDLRQASLAWQAAKDTLEETNNQLSKYQDDPNLAVKKVEKQLEDADNREIKSIEMEKVEEGKLANLAAQGPYSVLCQSEEELASIEREIESEQARVDAIKLLHEMVRTYQTKIMAAISSPVEAAATRTLRRIAGGKLGCLRLGDSFEPSGVVPEVSAQSVALDLLSGGEQEQISLATRLALAEVLARDERQLVVLDDVLTATDTGRLARVMTILEEASERMQVLVLTCHPERYAGLEGANFLDLEEILLQPVHRLPD